MTKSVLSDEKLAQVLPIMYNIYMRSHDTLFESNEIMLEGELFEDFWKPISRKLTLSDNYNLIDNFYYFMNALVQNSDRLEDGSLSPINVVNPMKKEYVIHCSERRHQSVQIEGNLQVYGYFTLDQLERDVYDLNNEGEFELWDYNVTDEDVYDSDSIDGVEVQNVEFKRVINESRTAITPQKNIDTFTTFLDSLTESEIRFLQTELSKRLL